MIVNNASLLLFVKYPREGQVKTRLAADIGHQNAAWFYRQFVELFLHRFRGVSGLDCTIYFDPIEEEGSIRIWLGESWDYLAQPAGDLGFRLQWGFENRFRYYPHVLAVASDSPDLPLEYIQQAIVSLRSKDMVIGPALDGGYYLIGLSTPALEIFQGIEWSTSVVLEQTIDKATSMKMSWDLLPAWYDVDTLDDLNRLRQSEYPDVQAIFQNQPVSMGRLYGHEEPGNRMETGSAVYSRTGEESLGED